MSIARPNPRRRPRQHPAATIPAAVVWTWAAAGAALTAATVALAAESAYDASAATTEMLRGFDLVTLILVVPLLALSLVGPRRRPLLGSGLLAYLAYAYLFAAVTGGLGVAFLLDIAVLCAATVALGLTLSGLWTVPLAVPRRSGARISAVVLGVLALSLGVMWVSAALGLVAVISGLLHQVSYLTALVFQAGADVPGARAFDPFEPFIVAAYLVALMALLDGLAPAEMPAPSEG